MCLAYEKEGWDKIWLWFVRNLKGSLNGTGTNDQKKTKNVQIQICNKLYLLAGGIHLDKAANEKKIAIFTAFKSIEGAFLEGIFSSRGYGHNRFKCFNIQDITLRGLRIHFNHRLQSLNTYLPKLKKVFYLNVLWYIKHFRNSNIVHFKIRTFLPGFCHKPLQTHKIIDWLILFSWSLH